MEKKKGGPKPVFLFLLATTREFLMREILVLDAADIDFFIKFIEINISKGIQVSDWLKAKIDFVHESRSLFGIVVNIRNGSEYNFIKSSIRYL